MTASRVIEADRHVSLRRRPIGRGRRLTELLSSNLARLIAMLAFIVIVALTGGGSRSDISSLLLLRPISIMFAAYAILQMTREGFARVRVPMLVVIAIMALALFQLVPLPELVWQSLPVRDQLADLSGMLGVAGVARPISLDPSRTWNTFFSLFVPLAAISLYAIQAREYRRFALIGLIGIGLASALLGLMQTLGGDELYFYRITNDQYPVGLFANRNHQAVFMAWTVAAIAFLTVNERRLLAKGRSFRVIIVGVIALLLILMILTGSRTGLALSVPAVLMASAFHVLARPPGDSRQFGLFRLKGWRSLLASAVTAMSTLLIVVLALGDRTLAVERLFNDGTIEDVRWSYLPLLWRMAVDFFPFGTGLGAFERTFEMFEPDSTLSFRYLNHAHNDLLQFVIEGGLVGLLILLGSLTWIARRLLVSIRSRSSIASQLTIFYGGSIIIWLVASLPDYPLRTPIVALTFAVLTAALSSLTTNDRVGGSV